MQSGADIPIGRKVMFRLTDRAHDLNLFSGLGYQGEYDVLGAPEVHPPRLTPGKLREARTAAFPIIHAGIRRLDDGSIALESGYGCNCYTGTPPHGCARCNAFFCRYCRLWRPLRALTRQKDPYRGSEVEVVEILQDRAGVCCFCFVTTVSFDRVVLDEEERGREVYFAARREETRRESEREKARLEQAYLQSIIQARALARSRPCWLPFWSWAKLVFSGYYVKLRESTSKVVNTLRKWW